jgi:predicted nucleic acid-binding protein
VLAPSLLWLELLNVAARRWRWRQTRLEQLAVTLPKVGFELPELELAGVARWAPRGLTAYDAAYLAVAEQAGAQIITDDEQIVRSAPHIATALGGAPAIRRR